MGPNTMRSCECFPYVIKMPIITWMSRVVIMFSRILNFSSSHKTSCHMYDIMVSYIIYILNSSTQDIVRHDRETSQP